ncbi:class I SAM-dependent methyltransferase [Caballeronia sp. SEWSISQ10-4 2]|uniref:SAM-dependent methyltransferase n=1 Tax=Caballeronia sp. SEWSISQ10-4 2 TaxID=2937438 RepID=UPI00264DC234|nr:class I SAM-dependent methyltransferase [Caballeronia sp. SEWSISQ10-4 2]MDN7182886.1 class I SAM-dependent methyltransferase [Caballeronia sp. SEWSISQ10-4 2]
MKTPSESQTSNTSHNRLISHGADSQNGWEDLLHAIKARLREAGDLPGATVDQQVSLLEQLSAFELGRFLLENRGLNAYWTHQLVNYRQSAEPAGSMSPLEVRVFERLPAVLATRERFGIFRQQLQALLKPGLALVSIPCGLMGELLLLDYEGQSDITLTGIDLDQAALNGALALAKERGLADRLSLRCEDAWISGPGNEFDVLASNGLNIYEPDNARVTALYRAFFNKLKPGGTLVTSFLTPPPALSEESPWNLTEIDHESLALQHLMFVRVIEAKWSAFRTHAQTMAQLGDAGFVDIRFIDDRARMFPTVVAQKPLQ